MVEDWTAVAKAISARATELDLRQKDLAERSGVSLAIIREIQQDRIHRRRNPRTLEALSGALGWHPQHLTAVLHGEEPPPRGAPLRCPCHGTRKRPGGTCQQLATLNATRVKTS